MRVISQLSVSYINVGSLLTTLEPFLDFTREFRHDVMGITETWLHAGIDSSVVQMDNYNFDGSDRRPTKVSATWCRLIDLIFINIDSVSEAEVQTSQLSDHFPVCMKVTLDSREFCE